MPREKVSPKKPYATGCPDRLDVSVAICCHNSARRVSNTLAKLKGQRLNDPLQWEVLVIDNASTDGTEAAVRQAWGDDGPAPLRVIMESRLGLSYARERAFTEARHEIITFVDDDNWVGPDWIATVSECMSLDTTLGAIGSINTAVADVRFPEWFSRYCMYYAAWAYDDSARIASWVLNGAGMTIRRTAWRDLRQSGFRPQLPDRMGTLLSSGGDLEIGCALQLAGWKIRIEPRLWLEHYMMPARLQWRYLRRLLRAAGECHVGLDCYLLVPQTLNPTLTNRLRQCWWLRFGKEALELLCSRSPITLAKSFVREMENDYDVADIELRLGRLRGLLRLRSHYGQLRREIAQAPWRRAVIMV